MLNIMKMMPVGKLLYDGVTSVLQQNTESPVGKIKKSEVRAVLLSAFDMVCGLLKDYIIDDES